MATGKCMACGHKPVAYDADVCPKCGSKKPVMDPFTAFFGKLFFFVITAFMLMQCMAEKAKASEIRRTSSGVGIVIENGQDQFTGSQELYSDDSVRIFESIEDLKAACRHDEYALAVIHKVPATFVFDADHFSSISEKVWKKVGHKCTGARHFVFRHYVEGVDLAKAKRFQLGDTLDSSTMFLNSVPLHETRIFSLDGKRIAREWLNNDSFCDGDECRWTGSGFNLKTSVPLTAENVQNLFNPQINSWIKRGEMRWEEKQAQAERRPAEQEREILAGILIVLGLYGMHASSPCNDPDEREKHLHCGH